MFFRSATLIRLDLFVTDQLHELFRRHERLYNSDDPTAIADDYNMPLIVFSEGEFRRELGADEIDDILWKVRGELLRTKSTLTLDLMQIDERENGRTDVLVNLCYRKSNNIITRQTSGRFYCRTGDDGRPLIEMVEYLLPGVPSLYEWIRDSDQTH